MSHSFSAGNSPSKSLYKLDKVNLAGSSKVYNKDEEASKHSLAKSMKLKNGTVNKGTTLVSPYASNPKCRVSVVKSKLQSRSESEDAKSKLLLRRGSSKNQHKDEKDLQKINKKAKKPPLPTPVGSKEQQTGQPILTQNGVNQHLHKHSKDDSAGNFASECLDAIKRYTTGTPRRTIKSVVYNKENDKTERRSRTESPAKCLPRSPKKDAKNQKPEEKPTELECVWSFEKDIMWSLNPLNNKRSGYILFSCLNLDKPSLGCSPAKYEMTFRFSQADSKLLRLVLESHGFTEVNDNKFNLFWGNSHFNLHEMKHLQEWQKVNHFPRSSELTRKDRLYMNIKRMQRNFGVKLFDFIPTSFVLPTEYRDFCDTYLRERGTWIVKPVASSQGKGIYLASQMDQVPSDEIAVVCKYLENPLLVNGYKCDLRLYVCVTSLDPLIVYLYEEGLVRLATVKYQHGKNLWNPCIHLTNYSVNKFHSNYIQNEDADIEDRGNKWSLSAFLKHLKARGVDTGSLMRRIEDVILKSLLSASYQMTTATNIFVPHSRNCFELYGFDILIDSDLKPWILEVNLSPSLNMDQPLDLKIKSAMLVDLFSLVGIQTCNPNTAKYSTRHSLLRKLPNLRYSTESYEKSHFGRAASNGDSKFTPSIEELKMIKQVKEESERKGCWARIFPTPDSWAMYGGLLEYESPLNLILHHHLYPDIPRATRSLRVAPLRSSSISSRGLASSLQRLVCYERTLPKGFASLKHKFNKGMSKKDDKQSQLHVNTLKASLVEAMESGFIFSKYQARMTFSVYLQHIQRRLMIGCDQDKQTELVYRFLRSASRTLQMPIGVQAPSKTLPKESRAVIMSKQLGDFIKAYTKETQMYFDQAASMSCSSLSSQCAPSTVPTPSDPKPYPSLPSLDVTSQQRPSRPSASAKETGVHKSLPNRRLHRTANSSLSTSAVSLLSTTSLPEAKGIPPFGAHVTPTPRQSAPSITTTHPSWSKPSLTSVSSSSISIYDENNQNIASISSTIASNAVHIPRMRSDTDSGIGSGNISKSESMELSNENVSRQSRKSSHTDTIAMELYRAFLSSAGESDLEEVLALQTRMQNSTGVFLDPPRRTKSQRATTSSQSAGQTPSVSPHGSPRRGRRTPAPVTTEPHSTSSPSLNKDGVLAPPSTVASCCLFMNILKASLRGTNTSLSS